MFQLRLSDQHFACAFEKNGRGQPRYFVGSEDVTKKPEFWSSAHAAGSTFQIEGSRQRFGARAQIYIYRERQQTTANSGEFILNSGRATKSASQIVHPATPADHPSDTTSSQVIFPAAIIITVIHTAATLSRSKPLRHSHSSLLRDRCSSGRIRKLSWSYRKVSASTTSSAAIFLDQSNRVGTISL